MNPCPVPAAPMELNDELAMELDWTLIDYLLDEGESPDLQFPVDFSLPIFNSNDLRGELL